MTDPFSVPRETDKLPFWVWYCFLVLCLNLIDAFPFRLSELSNFWDLSLYFICLTFPVFHSQHGRI